MALTVKELLKIAASQIGYREKATNAQLDSPAANAGSSNWTKYARDLHAAGYYNGNKNGFDWCDVFVDWCFFQLCGKDAKKAQEVQCQTGPYGAGCMWSLKYYKDQGRFFTGNPQPGDQIFFGNVSHTGIVERVTADKIHTIEGNASNRVKRCTYKRTDPNINGFGRPKYEAEPKPAETKREEITVKVSILTKGSKGKQVKALQALLIGYGYRCGSSGVDGSFGPSTDAALRKFQRAHGLAVDGSCGPATWARLLGV